MVRTFRTPKAPRDQPRRQRPRQLAERTSSPISSSPYRPSHWHHLGFILHIIFGFRPERSHLFRLGRTCFGERNSAPNQYTPSVSPTQDSWFFWHSSLFHRPIQKAVSIEEACCSYHSYPDGLVLEPWPSALDSHSS